MPNAFFKKLKKLVKKTRLPDTSTTQTEFENLKLMHLRYREGYSAKCCPSCVRQKMGLKENIGTLKENKYRTCEHQNPKIKIQLKHTTTKETGMTQPFWEKTYADLNTTTFGEPSQEIKAVAANLPKGAKVLDLGCGEGRNALFLAECGFDVTAVDISILGIRKLNALANERNLKIHTQVVDMKNYEFTQSYDLIISHGCLHLISREQWQPLVQKIKKHTKPGGMNIVLVFTNAEPAPADMAAFCIGLFEDGELFSHFSNWEPILHQSYTFDDEHPGNIKHTHSVNKLVAKKPMPNLPRV